MRSQSSLSSSLPPIDRRGLGGANSSMAISQQRSANPNTESAKSMSSPSEEQKRPAVLNASYFKTNGLRPLRNTSQKGGAGAPSHATRSAYGEHIRSIVKENASRRDETYAAGGQIGGVKDKPEREEKRGREGNGRLAQLAPLKEKPSSLDGGLTPTSRKAASERVSENVVDINVREEAARRRAVGPAIDSRKAKDYTVDWSSFEVSDIPSLRQRIPRVGETFRINQDYLQKLSAEKAEEAKAIKQMVDHERLKDIYTFGESTKQVILRNPDTATNQLTYVKAKDRTYAFVDRATTLEDEGPATKKVGRWLVRNSQGVLEERILTGNELQQHEERMKLYRCSVLRLTNNKLSSIGPSFSEDLKQLLFRPIIHLAVIDLSSNLINTIATEGLIDLPLHTLYLHDNKIADAQEIYKLEPLANTLRKLTLYGNPLQRKVHPDLRPIAIAILPFLTVFDDAPVVQREKEDALASKRAQPAALLKAQQERQRLLNAKARAEASAAAQNSGFFGGYGGGSPGFRSQSRAGSPSQSPNRATGGRAQSASDTSTSVSANQKD